jgi:hypothetical protein
VKSAWWAELVKIATVRGQWISAVLATLAIPLASFLVVSTGGLSPGESSTSGAATGSMAGLLAFGVWSTTIASGEYANGTMVLSLATVPRRLVLVAAKLLAVATTAGAGAVISALAGLLIVLGVRAPDAHGIGNPASLVSIVVAVVTVAVLGASIGLITRSPSASIVIVALALLLPRAASGLLGGLEPWVVGASPDTVVTQIVGGVQLPASQTYPAGTWAAVLTMAAAAVVVAGGSALVFVRRDG